MATATTTVREARQADFVFKVGSFSPGVLQVVRFQGTEEMSRLYSFEIELASEEQALDFAQVVGQAAVLTIFGQEGERHVHGIIRRFEQAGEGYRFTHYIAEMVPTFWLLTQRYCSRIFQNKTVPEIIAEVLTGAGIPGDAFRQAMEKEHPSREYCVQYRETDFDFLSRLMEEEGICYFFEHTLDKHVIVMGDSPVAHVPLAAKPEILFHPPSGMVAAEEHIDAFRYAETVESNAITLRDYTFKKPKLNMQTQADASDNGKLEISDYPGEYVDPGVGKDLSQVRLQESQAKVKTGFGGGIVRRLLAGYKYTMTQHPRDEFNREYLLTRLRHQGTHPQLLGEDSGGGAPGEPLYRCEFRCIPSDVPFRPERITPRPFVHGAQTAHVVGPSGEEIYTDEYGRVKVQFHWDRFGKYDEKSSCWIRVSQGWAGGQYGIMFLPRVGQEVIVDFLEGDPDQPIITGRVYNAEQMPPYPLPDEKTKSCIKTNSSKGGGGTNEIRFEDKKDSEQIFVHAQKDYHIRVTNDRIENVEANRNLTVGGSKFEQIDKDSHLTIKQDHNTKIERDRNVTVVGQQSISIEKSYSLRVQSDVVEQFLKNHKHEVGATYAAKATSIKLEATSGIELKCGGSSVVLTPSAVFIVGGPTINLNSGNGPAVAPVSASATTPLTPKAPASADDATPGKDTTYGGGEEPEEAPKPQEVPGVTPTRDTEQAPTSWVSFDLKDEETGEPIPNEPYQVRLPDGTIRKGSLDEQGRARIDGIPPGQCEINFPRIDKNEWRRG